MLSSRFTSSAFDPSSPRNGTLRNFVETDVWQWVLHITVPGRLISTFLSGSWTCCMFCLFHSQNRPEALTRRQPGKPDSTLRALLVLLTLFGYVSHIQRHELCLYSSGMLAEQTRGATPDKFDLPKTKRLNLWQATYQHLSMNLTTLLVVVPF